MYLNQNNVIRNVLKLQTLLRCQEAVYVTCTLNIKNLRDFFINHGALIEFNLQIPSYCWRDHKFGCQTNEEVL